MKASAASKKRLTATSHYGREQEDEGTVCGDRFGASCLLSTLPGVGYLYLLQDAVGTGPSVLGMQTASLLHGHCSSAPPGRLAKSSSLQIWV